VYPVQSIASIEDDPTEAFDGSTYLVSSSDYTSRPDGVVLLKLTATHGAWSDSDNQVIKVVATIGHATVPPRIKQAAGMLVKHWWELRHQQGRANASQGGGSVGLRDETLPEPVRELLAHDLLPGAMIG
jgi:hypothetical protein